MVSGLAKGDWEKLRAQGYNPTLEDFDRLNQIALRLTDGAETTCANFPRVGWAGDIPFHEPTFAAYSWFHTYAARAAANDDTQLTLWAFALAHGRDPSVFAPLVTPHAIDKAVSKWAEGLGVTREEVIRACHYAVAGFDDAIAAKPDNAEDDGDNGNPMHRASKDEAAANLAELEKALAKACAALHAAPDVLQGESISRIERICEAAAIELGKNMEKDEAKLRADYDLTFREIFRRLKAEKEAADGAAHG